MTLPEPRGATAMFVKAAAATLALDATIGYVLSRFLMPDDGLVGWAMCTAGVWAIASLAALRRWLALAARLFVARGDMAYNYWCGLERMKIPVPASSDPDARFYLAQVVDDPASSEEVKLAAMSCLAEDMGLKNTGNYIVHHATSRAMREGLRLLKRNNSPA